MLADGQAQAEIQAIHRYTFTGQPWGGEAFVARSERQTGRNLRLRPIGRPRKRKREETRDGSGKPRKA